MIDPMWMIRPQRFSRIAGESARVRAMPAHKVELDQAIPVFVLDLFDRLRRIAAGVVDQDINPAKRPLCVACKPLGLVAHGRDRPRSI